MIVDSHTHILPPDVVSDMPKFMSRDETLRNLFRNGSRVSTAETLLNSMNQNKIDYSIVMGMGWSDYSFNQYVNEYLIESQINQVEDSLPSQVSRHNMEIQVFTKQNGVLLLAVMGLERFIFQNKRWQENPSIFWSPT